MSEFLKKIKKMLDDPRFGSNSYILLKRNNKKNYIPPEAIKRCIMIPKPDISKAIIID